MKIKQIPKFQQIQAKIKMFSKQIFSKNVQIGWKSNSISWG